MNRDVRFFATAHQRRFGEHLFKSELKSSSVPFIVENVRKIIKRKRAIDSSEYCFCMEITRRIVSASARLNIPIKSFERNIDRFRSREKFNDPMTLNIDMRLSKYFCVNLLKQLTPIKFFLPSRRNVINFRAKVTPMCHPFFIDGKHDFRINVIRRCVPVGGR
jgi:hypothetical protein